MVRKRAHRVVALMLALLVVLPVVSGAATTDGGATPAWSINWNKVLGYAECGVGVFVSVASGGGTLLWAGIICARVLLEQN